MKINYSKTKEQLYNELKPLLIKTNLDQILRLSDLTSIGEEFGEELERIKIEFYISLFVTSISFTIFILLMFQNIKLYIKDNNSNILVKTFLGYSKIKIFKDIYVNNILSTLFAMLIPITYVIFLQKISLHYVYLISSCLIIILLEQLILHFILKNKNLNTVTKMLKGDKND